MRRRKAQRIMTFEEFTLSPRTALEIESYHVLLADLRRLGVVDDDLNIVERKARS